MKILTSAQIKETDRLTIEKEPISSLCLMERASVRFTQWFTKRFGTSNPVVVFAGQGNNGGDALAISRLLIERNFSVKVYLLSAGSTLSPDCRINLEKLKAYTNPGILDENSVKNFPVIGPNEIVIDGIFGSGLNRIVEGVAADLIRHINRNEGSVVSIDIPSGLFGEDNRYNNPENIIRANYTVSFEFPFLSFFMKENEKFTGDWNIIPIGLHKESVESLKTSHFALDADEIRKLLISRNKYSHKGSFGHALIIAGRYGMMGAAVLSARACLRGGAGLTTVCIPRAGYNIIQTSAPEALIELGKADEYFSEVPDLSQYQAIACGPAIGKAQATSDALRELIMNAKVPLVLDADALNIISEHKEWMEHLPSGSVITPHPKEFDRLAGESPDMYSRHLKQVEMAKKFKIVVILKGAHTIITSPDGVSYINTAGNPGMSTGGTGDVLTGLVVSLLAQGYSSLSASNIAVFIHGLAADIAVNSGSMEALIAGDIIENLGRAFRLVKGRG